MRERGRTGTRPVGKVDGKSAHLDCFMQWWAEQEVAESKSPDGDPSESGDAAGVGSDGSIDGGSAMTPAL